MTTSPTRTRLARRSILAAAGAAALLGALVHAQVQVGGGGHALDNSLRLGSGGYNGRTWSAAAINPRLYSPGVYNRTAYNSPGVRATEAATRPNFAYEDFVNSRRWDSLTGATPYRPGGYTWRGPSRGGGGDRVNDRESLQPSYRGGTFSGTFSYPVDPESPDLRPRG